MPIQNQKTKQKPFLLFRCGDAQRKKAALAAIALLLLLCGGRLLLSERESVETSTGQPSRVPQSLYTLLERMHEGE